LPLNPISVRGSIRRLQRELGVPTYCMAGAIRYTHRCLEGLQEDSRWTIG
jgi:hypothetical protein